MTKVAGLPALVESAGNLVTPGERRLLGIVGAPGSGKSTLAEALSDAIGADSVVVPMDGFHLAQRELQRLGRVERKGAIDTFDGAGFVALVRRLWTPGDDVIYAPAFDRAIEEPIAGSIPIPREVPLVIIEGNYLLVDQQPWRELRSYLTQCWYVRIDEALRLERLVARHKRFGRSPEAAREHAHGSDQHNADLIASTARRADRVIDLTG
jgi:pantothenate kinase